MLFVYHNTYTVEPRFTRLIRFKKQLVNRNTRRPKQIFSQEICNANSINSFLSVEVLVKMHNIV